jgi:hypothetical protein
MSDAENKENCRHQPQMFQSQSKRAKPAPPKRPRRKPVCWPITNGPRAFDELLTDEGEPRPHYENLFQALEQLGRG